MSTEKQSQAEIALGIWRDAFSGARDPRSAEYKQGVLEVLNLRLGVCETLPGKQNLVMGTAQADAYLAGTDEGHRLASDYLAGRKAR